MGQFWIWSENLQIRLKCVIGAFSFSSKNTSIILEPLSRGWHKNWQPTCCQEGARPCWKVGNIQNSEVSSNFPLLSFFLNIIHPCSYKQPVNIHYSSAFTVGSTSSQHRHV